MGSRGLKLYRNINVGSKIISVKFEPQGGYKGYHFETVFESFVFRLSFVSVSFEFRLSFVSVSFEFRLSFVLGFSKIV